MPEDLSHEALSPPPRRRPPRTLLVVYDPPPEEIGAEIDWSQWYLTEEEDMGQSPDQTNTAKVFASSLELLAEEQGWQDVRIGLNEFFGWMKQEAEVRVSPDVFLHDHPPSPPYPGMWQTWETGVLPPRFALEIVSRDWKKDYELNPPKYAWLGTSELVIFDPEAATGATQVARRESLQMFRREADGSFAKVSGGGGPAYSAELAVWLVVVRKGPEAFLRLSRDPEGRDLLPTQEEARQQAEGLYRQEQAARQKAEQQKAELEHMLTQARAELARLQKYG